MSELKKWDTYEFDKTEYSFFYVPFYPPIYLLAYYIYSQITCFYCLSKQTTLRQICFKNLQAFGTRLMWTKNKEQPSTTSRKIVGVDKPTNLSGCNLLLDRSATSSGKKELVLYFFGLSYPLPSIQSIFFLYFK